jgi:undecaprenyl diphosphate synthase
VVGNVAAFGATIADLVRRAEARTAANRGLTLTIAANYGGRWDLLQAVNAMVRAHPERAGAYTEADLAPYLALSYAPEPDLFIRTGGEKRISNFLIWQLAYTELWFTDILWPDFDAAALGTAIDSYQQRERRFGRTSEQVVEAARRARDLEDRPQSTQPAAAERD